MTTPINPAATQGKGAFTQGPWSVERVDYELYGLDASFEVSAGFRTIVQTHMREIKTEGEWLDEDEANCRLIAASPDMFAALGDLEQLIRNVAPEYAESTVASNARIVLAKARGEA